MEKEADRDARMEPQPEKKKNGNMGVKRVAQFMGFFSRCLMLTMCLLRFHASSHSCFTLWGSHRGEKLSSEEALAFMQDVLSL